MIRAAAVAQGDLLGKPVDGFEEGYRQVTVPGTLASGDPACFRHDETIDGVVRGASTSSATDVAVATSAGTAPPWYYAIVGVVARVLVGWQRCARHTGWSTVLLCAVVLGYALAAQPPLLRVQDGCSPRSRRRRGSCSAWWAPAGSRSRSSRSRWSRRLVGSIRTPDTASLWRVMAPLSICLLLRPAALIDVAVVALVLYPTVPRPLTKRCVAILALPLVAVGVATRRVEPVDGAGRQRHAHCRLGLVDVGASSIPRRHPEHRPPSRRRTRMERVLRPSRRPTRVDRGAGVRDLLGLHPFAPIVSWHVKWIVAALLLPTILEVLLHRRIGAIWQGRYSIPFAMAGVLYAATTVAPPRRVAARDGDRRRVRRGADLVAHPASLHGRPRRLTDVAARRVEPAAEPMAADRDQRRGDRLARALPSECFRPTRVGVKHSTERQGDDVAEDVDDVVGEAGVVVDRQLATGSELQVRQVRDRRRRVAGSASTRSASGCRSATP